MNDPAEYESEEANNPGNISSEVSEQSYDMDIDQADKEESSEFALKMINFVKLLNSGDISHYDLINAFSLEAELKCLFLFLKSLPLRPIVPLYPETPFLFFKGVPLPRSFDLFEETVNDVESYIKSKNSEYLKDLHLHDLSQYYLDAYESATSIYNDMVEKSRFSYMASVKQAKSQVIEISAAFTCGLVIILALFGLS